MYPYETPHYKTTGPRDGHVLTTIVDCGPLAARALAAEERHREGVQMAAVWRATHPDGTRTPRSWRLGLGTLLVRLGTRLGGTVTPAPVPELAQAMH